MSIDDWATARSLGCVARKGYMTERQALDLLLRHFELELRAGRLTAASLVVAIGAFKHGLEGCNGK